MQWKVEFINLPAISDNKTRKGINDISIKLHGAGQPKFRRQ